MLLSRDTHHLPQRIIINLPIKLSLSATVYLLEPMEQPLHILARRLRSIAGLCVHRVRRSACKCDSATEGGRVSRVPAGEIDGVDVRVARQVLDE